MLATMLKHSRYFIANRSHVNNPEFTAGRDEISARFYEGVAAGTVMIGEAPRTDEFKRQFDWPDAVIHVPFNSPDVADILADLNRDPARLATVSAGMSGRRRCGTTGCTASGSYSMSSSWRRPRTWPLAPRSSPRSPHTPSRPFHFPAYSPARAGSPSGCQWLTNCETHG